MGPPRTIVRDATPGKDRGFPVVERDVTKGARSVRMRREFHALAGHGIVDAMPAAYLHRIHGQIAGCVAGMPMHQAFIDRHCMAVVA